MDLSWSGATSATSTFTATTLIADVHHNDGFYTDSLATVAMPLTRYQSVQCRHPNLFKSSDGDVLSLGTGELDD